jgi:glycosyltransferase involved in cell wall biosynthesis
MKTLIAIPAYNEAQNITNVINDLKQHIPQAHPIIINDGSQDNTSSVAHSLGIRVVDIPYNIGIGGAVQIGFMYASRENYDMIVQFDGDGQHMAKEIEKLLHPITQGADIVIGSRFLDLSGYNAPFARNLGIKVFSIVISFLCRQKLTDTTSGFRAFSKKAIDLFSTYYPEDYPEVEALIIAYKKKLNIKEMPVTMRQRLKGKSSITPLRSIYYMIKVLLAVFVDLLKR